MKSIVVLISMAASTLASGLLSVPFTAVDRKSLNIPLNNLRKLGTHVNAPLENVDLAYLIDLSIGSPPQNFSLLLDTGSSTTWVPLYSCGVACGLPRNRFNPNFSRSFRPLNSAFSIKYGEGFSKGYYGRDVFVVNNVTIPGVNFAISNANDGLLTEDGADGIMGIGPDQLSIYNNPQRRKVPTLITTMYQRGIIKRPMFSIYFQPVQKTNNNDARHKKRINGQITFGGVQRKYFEGRIKAIPITKKKIYTDYWAVDIEKIYVGTHVFHYPKGITAMVDTGSTLISLPNKVAQYIFRSVRGAQKNRHGQYLVPCNADLPDITITMNGHKFTITPKDYVITSGFFYFSRTLCYTYIHESPSFVGAILGYGFLQQYVSIYDGSKKRIMLAKRAELN